MTRVLPTGIEKIDHILLYSTDLDRSEHFYRDVLGIQRVLLRLPHALFLVCGEITLMFDKVQGPLHQARHVPEIYFRVSDIHHTHQLLCQRGVIFHSDPTPISTADGQEIWLAGFHDPDHQPLQLICNRARAAAGNAAQ